MQQQETAKAAEPRNCPLCGKMGVVPFLGEKYDYETHSKECEELKEIKEPYKRLLLQSKIEKRAFGDRFGDTLDIDKYLDIFKEQDLWIDIQNYREKVDFEGRIRVWAYTVTVDSYKYPRQFFSIQSNYPTADGRYFDDAFRLLKHFLICGEKIKINSPKGIKVWHWDHQNRTLVYEGIQPEQKEG